MEWWQILLIIIVVAWILSPVERFFKRLNDRIDDLEYRVSKLEDGEEPDDDL